MAYLYKFTHISNGLRDVAFLFPWKCYLARESARCCVIGVINMEMAVNISSLDVKNFIIIHQI